MSGPAAKFPLEEDFKSEWSAPQVTLDSRVRKPRSSPSHLERFIPGLDPLKWACLCVHLVLIIFFFSLAVAPSLPSQQFGFRILKQIPPFGQDTATLVTKWMNSGVTGFVTVLSTLLVTTTSSLALRRQLHIRGTLTDKHDSNEAWSSLGSAVMTTVLSRKPLAGRTSLVALLYLGGIALLHILSSSLLVVNPFDNYFSTIVATQGLPDFIRGATNFIAGPGSLMTLDALNNFALTGLHGDTIYDVPVENIALAADSFNVNATQFSVTCGSVAGSIALDQSQRRQLVLDSGIPVILDSFMSGSSVTLYSPPWAGAQDPNDVSTFWPPTIFVVSTVPIIDNAGQRGSPISLNPPFNYVPFDSQSAGTLSQIQEVTVLGCNLTLNENVVANISSRSHELLDLKGLVANNALLAKYPVASREPLRLDGTDAVDSLLRTWSQIPVIQAVSALSDRFISTCNQASDVCKPLYQHDQFIMESLNMYPDLIFHSGKSKSSVSLDALETALSIMTANTFWAQANGRNALFANELTFEQDPTAPQVSQIFFQQHNSTVLEHTQQMRVNINVPYVYLALILGIILLILAMPGIVYNNQAQVKSAGILQILWLLEAHPEIQKMITQINDPSTQNLREAGMMEVDFGHTHGDKQIWNGAV
ncbi:hypothetical protein C8J56DRAFT_952532 [Mycena floridula]|nr:hypothetical protein C8J56DRAFT_952532 [Mycena floridula]